MPLKSGRMTPKEKRFAKAYADTSDALYSARVAGYASPETHAQAIAERPEVMAQAREIQKRRITNEILPLAVAAHIRLLTDKNTPAGAVVQAVKLAYDRAFGEVADGESKAPHELTGDELARQIERLRQEAAARAQPVIVDIIPEKPADLGAVFE